MKTPRVRPDLHQRGDEGRKDSKVRAQMVRLTAVALGVCVVMVLGAGSPRGAQDGESADALVARMDDLWARRDAQSAMPEIVSLATTGLANDPHSYEVEWRLARAYFWVANTQSNRVAKKAVAVKGVEWADRARTQRPDRVEGHYFYAIAVGEYASTIGIMQAVMDGVAGRIETAASRAYEIDRDFDHGGPGTVLGRFYYLLPWPKRDMAGSRRYLEEVVARHPRKLIARVYLAETYYDLGEHDRAREQLAFVLANDVEPGSELDRPAPKALAQDSMQRWFPAAAAANRQPGG